MTKERKTFLPNEPSKHLNWIYNHKERHARRIKHALEHLDKIKEWAELNRVEIKIVENGLSGMAVQFLILKGKIASTARWTVGSARFSYSPWAGIIKNFRIKVYDYEQVLKQLDSWIEKRNKVFGKSHDG